MFIVPKLKKSRCGGDVVTTGDAEVWLRGDVMPRPWAAAPWPGCCCWRSCSQPPPRTRATRTRRAWATPAAPATSTPTSTTTTPTCTTPLWARLLSVARLWQLNQLWNEDRPPQLVNHQLEIRKINPDFSCQIYRLFIFPVLWKNLEKLPETQMLNIK